MALQIEIKTVYGEVKYYPVNDAAKTFAAIAGTKTLSIDNLKRIKSLGIAIEYVEALAFARV
jgi:hypothetical protein